jgi:hypothetical protein
MTLAHRKQTVEPLQKFLLRQVRYGLFAFLLISISVCIDVWSAVISLLTFCDSIVFTWLV